MQWGDAYRDIRSERYLVSISFTTAQVEIKVQTHSAAVKNS